MKNLTKNSWCTFSQPVTNSLMSYDQISLALEKFNEEILIKLTEDQYMLIIFRIKTEENFYRNVSTFTQF